MVRFFMRRGSRETAAEPFPHPSLSKPRLLEFGMAGGCGGQDFSSQVVSRKRQNRVGQARAS
jgi:hypothetical protein